MIPQEKTPQKRRRTDCGETPLTRNGGDDSGELRLCVEMGNMAGRTAKHARFSSKEMYGALLVEKEGWHSLEARESGQSCRMIAIDVEMIELDGKKLPVSAAVLVYDSPRIGTEPRVVFDGLILPCENWQAYCAQIIWKTEFHGISEKDLRENELSPLSTVWTAISNEFHDLTFLAGHRLCGDLRALRICGPSLRRRILDTSILHWFRGPPSLSRLAATTSSAHLLQHLSAHDAKADAIMTATILLDDLALLTTDLTVDSFSSSAEKVTATGCESGNNALHSQSPSQQQQEDLLLPSQEQATAASLHQKENHKKRRSDQDDDASRLIRQNASLKDRREAVLVFDDKLVGRLIGKGGAKISAISARSPLVSVQLASKSTLVQGRFLKRRLSICGEHAADINACLDLIASNVPDLASLCTEARLSP